MQIESLQVFKDLVEKQSFSEAAKVNGITQSAVSQKLKVMEKTYNTPIIDNSQKQFQLTPEGHILYESAKEILHAYEAMLCKIQTAKKEIAGLIRISTTSSIGLHELPRYIKQFLKEHPTVRVNIEYRRAKHVYEDILEGIADLGFVAFHSKTRHITAIPFLEEEMVLVCSPESPLSTKSRLPFKELEQHPFIHFDSDVPSYGAIQDVFKKYNIAVETAMSFYDTENIKRAVEINAGIAILPKTNIARELEQGLLCTIPIDWEDFMRPISIIHHQNKLLTPAMKKFIDMFLTT
tara:strand:+ start:24835 stop:25713 length:879 start_codon:yes stop_codon:yes gene_type:complete